MKQFLLDITLSVDDAPHHAQRLRQLQTALFGTAQESFRWRGNLTPQQLRLIGIWQRRGAFALVEVA